jgi:AI-2 transport protein TqsA
MVKKSGNNEQHIQTVCLLILTALGIAGSLYAFSSILIPFVLAVFLTLCLTPVIDVQVRRLSIPRGAAILTTALAGCAFLVLTALLVTAAVNQIVQNKGEYQEQVRQVLVQTRGLLPDEWYSSDPNDPNDPSGPLIHVPSQTVRRTLADTASSIMSVVSNGLLVMIFMIFMVAGRGARRAPPGSLWQEVDSRVRRYVLTMVFTSGITGIIVGLVLTILGVKFGWMFGFLAFLLNFIPNIGSVVATLLPLPVALIDPQLGATSRILVLVIPGIIQFVIGNIVQPRMMGQTLDLHPVAILMSLIFFGTIWGIIGMFLATPITAVVKILLDRFDYMRPIANLLAGRLDILEKSHPPGIVS